MVRWVMETCPKCAGAEAVKNGNVRGKQRYRCKACGCNFTQSSMSRIPLEMRRKCIELYLEGVGFRGIERLTKVSHVTVMKWVKKLGDRIETLRPHNCGEVSVMELDEMWHFVQKKHKSVGCGLPTTVMERKSAGSI